MTREKKISRSWGADSVATALSVKCEVLRLTLSVRVDGWAQGSPVAHCWGDGQDPGGTARYPVTAKQNDNFEEMRDLRAFLSFTNRKYTGNYTIKNVRDLLS